MSTTALKLTTLAIRTLAKPIATRIKAQARDHPRFRKICISVAQRLHRIDMRLRLGLLRDTAENIAKAEQAEKTRRREEALKKMKEAEALYPGLVIRVRSDVPEGEELGSVAREREKEGASQGVGVDKGVIEQAQLNVRDSLGGKMDGKLPDGKTAEKTPAPAPRIRPLSESKAIDAGANFISEAFLFAVAGSLILAEAWRSRRKEASRRDVVTERLELLEQRKRQDEMRLEEQEELNKLQQEKLIELEKQIWILRGNREEDFPGGEIRGQSWTPTPLWEKPLKEGMGVWQRVWRLGGGVKEEGEAQKEAAEENKEETKEKEQIERKKEEAMLVKNVGPTA
ncbi:optic atrophy 3 protein-domain-containing protein [Pyronema omphalodes]|nr:optic atrophy 3 protein-domain-containing protein [Pyronema omphalodes]